MSPTYPNKRQEQAPPSWYPFPDPAQAAIIRDLLKRVSDLESKLDRK